MGKKKNILFGASLVSAAASVPIILVTDAYKQGKFSASNVNGQNGISSGNAENNQTWASQTSQQLNPFNINGKLDVDVDKANTVYNEYKLKMDGAYQAIGHAFSRITKASQTALNDALKDGVYMPFSDGGQLFSNNAVEFLNQVRSGSTRLAHIGFLSAPNWGFAAESNGGSPEQRKLEDRLNFDPTTYLAKSGSDYEIPSSFAGSQMFDMLTGAVSGWSEGAPTTVNILDEIRKAGGEYLMSFGGWRHNTPAVAVSIANSTNPTKFNEYYLAAMYAYVIEKLDLNFIDFDIEGSDTADAMNVSSGGVLSDGPGQGEAPAPSPEQAIKGRELRIKALKILKSMPAFKNKIHVSFTLPTMQTGLRDNVLSSVVEGFNEGVLDKLNIMTMDYANEKYPTLPGQMGLAVIASINAIVNQLKADPRLQIAKDKSLYTKIGITPMLGKNDVANETFFITDAKLVANWAIAHNIGFMSAWVYQRDLEELFHPGGSLSSGHSAPMRMQASDLAKSMGAISPAITEMTTGLDIKKNSFSNIFARVAKKEPVPLENIYLSSQFIELMHSIGFNSISEIFRYDGIEWDSDAFFNNHRSDMNDVVKASYQFELKANPEYQADNTKHEVPDDIALGALLTTAMKNTPLNQRNGRWGHGQALDSTTTNTYLPNKVFWYNGHWWFANKAGASNSATDASWVWYPDTPGAESYFTQIPDSFDPLIPVTAVGAYRPFADESYKSGDIVTYQGKLYMLVADYPKAAGWFGQDVKPSNPRWLVDKYLDGKFQELPYTTTQIDHIYNSIVPALKNVNAYQFKQDFLENVPSISTVLDINNIFSTHPSTTDTTWQGDTDAAHSSFNKTNIWIEYGAQTSTKHKLHIDYIIAGLKTSVVLDVNFKNSLRDQQNAYWSQLNLSNNSFMLKNNLYTIDMLNKIDVSHFATFPNLDFTKFTVDFAYTLGNNPTLDIVLRDINDQSNMKKFSLSINLLQQTSFVVDNALSPSAFTYASNKSPLDVVAWVKYNGSANVKIVGQSYILPALGSTIGRIDVDLLVNGIPTTISKDLTFGSPFSLRTVGPAFIRDDYGFVESHLTDALKTNPTLDASIVTRVNAINNAVNAINPKRTILAKTISASDFGLTDLGDLVYLGPDGITYTATKDKGITSSDTTIDVTVSTKPSFVFATGQTNKITLDVSTLQKVADRIIKDSDIRFIGTNGNGVVNIANVTGARVSVSKTTNLSVGESVQVNVSPRTGYVLYPGQQAQFTVTVNQFLQPITIQVHDDKLEEWFVNQNGVAAGPTGVFDINNKTYELSGHGNEIFGTMISRNLGAFTTNLGTDLFSANSYNNLFDVFVPNFYHLVSNGDVITIKLFDTTQEAKAYYNKTNPWNGTVVNGSTGPIGPRPADPNNKVICIAPKLESNYVWDQSQPRDIQVTARGFVDTPDKTATFVGGNGNGVIQLPYTQFNGTYYCGYQLDIDKRTGLSNGDHVRITLTSHNPWAIYFNDDQLVYDVVVSGLGQAAGFVEARNFTFGGANGSGSINIPTITGLDITASRTSDLHNGDKVIITVAAQNNFSFDARQQRTFEVTVAGLPEVASIATANDFTFSGTNGSGKIIIPSINGLTITSSKSTGLSIGEKVTITVVAQNGFVLNPTQQSTFEVTVGGLLREAQAVNASNITFAGPTGAGNINIPTITGLDISASKTTGLSNGDKVTITVAPQAGYALADNQQTSFEVTVSGLLPRAAVVTTGSIVFHGVTGAGSINIPTVEGLNITASKTTGLSNGDKVTITVAPQAGYALADNQQTSFEVTVSGLLRQAQLLNENSFTFAGAVGSGVISIPTVEGLSVSATPTDGLSNGDKVTITVIAQSGYQLSLNQQTSFEVTVSGLQKIAGFINPSNFTFSGVTGAGVVNAPTIEGLDISVTPANALSNGDKVDVTVRPQSGYALANNQQTNFQITVFGLSQVSGLVDSSNFRVAGNNGQGTINIPTVRGLNITASKTTGLSNGDKVTITVAPQAGYALATNQQTSFEVTVSGLHELAGAITEDNIQFSGDEGHAIIVLPNVTGLNITASKTTGLSNGDKVTITVEPQAGYTLASNQARSFVVMVSGLVTQSNAAMLVSPEDFEFIGTQGSGMIKPPVSKGLQLSFSKTTGLSNGDLVDVTIQAMDGYTLDSNQQTSFTVTVSGLATLVSNVLTLEDFVVSGYNGDGVLTFPTIPGMVVVASQTNKISNGDLITIRISAEAGKSLPLSQKTEFKLMVDSLI